MLLFRSEEHLHRWLEGREPGATLSVRQLSGLATAWWGDRLNPNWEPHTKAHNQQILEGLGLIDSFWRLP